MFTDTMIDAVLKEAGAIVWAEWIRLQQKGSLPGAFFEMTAARPRPPQAGSRTTVADRPAPAQPGAGGQWPARWPPHRRVWPTQRSPPGVNPNAIVAGRQRLG